MKFGKNIGRVVELSDPEWSPFWINYKYLKKKAKVGRVRVDDVLLSGAFDLRSLRTAVRLSS